MTETPKYKWQK